MIEFISSFHDLAFVLFAFIVGIGIVVCVHEGGHYLAARASGIEVQVFSIGFGPSLLKKTDRRGTEWRLSAIPLGGYVKFTESDSTSGPNETVAHPRGVPMSQANLFSRVLTVAAGPFANFIFTILVFAAFALANGVLNDDPIIGSFDDLPVSTGGLEVGDRIVEINENPINSFTELLAVGRNIPDDVSVVYTVERDANSLQVQGPHPALPIISLVQLQSPASAAGLEENDVVISVDGVPVKTFPQLSQAVKQSGSNELVFVVWRNGENVSLTVEPEIMDLPQIDGSFSQEFGIGISGGIFINPVVDIPNPLMALHIGISRTLSIISLTIEGIVWMIRGDVSSCNLQGPIGIAKFSGAAAEEGLTTFISLIAFLSTAIGFVNLLPIPVLDGGHLVFYFYEAVAGKVPSPAVSKYLMILGFVVLAGLMSFGIYNDLTC